MADSALGKTFVGLVRNAIEATEDGGCVWVELEDSHGKVYLRVRDRGLGISEAFKKELFHGFVHTGETDDYSSRTPYDFMAGGKGLDLLRTKLFAERYGFELQVESELGKGSCFSLEFPASTQLSKDRPD
jgi:signal transduction histidine kinase